MSKIKYIKKEGSRQKESFIATIPNMHALLYKLKLSALEEKAKRYDVVMENLRCLLYEGSDLGILMLRFGASLVPQCGYIGLANIVPFIA